MKLLLNNHQIIMKLTKKKEHKHKRHGSPSNYIYLKTRAKIQKLLTADFNDKHIRQKASDLLTEADRIPMTVEILKVILYI